MQQILPDGDLKPQAKHLLTRTEYLLKVLMRLTEGEAKKVEIVLIRLLYVKKDSLLSIECDFSYSGYLFKAYAGDMMKHW